MNGRFSFLLLLSAAALALTACDRADLTNPISPDDHLAGTETSAKTADQGVLAGRFNSFGEALNLTTEQRRAIRDIISKHRAARRESFPHAGVNRDAAAVRAEREAVRSEIMAVLTPDQRTKAEAFRAAAAQGQIPAELIEARLRRLDEKIHLTPVQKDQIRALMQQPPAASDGAAAPGFRNRANIRARIEALSKMLTPEQRQALRDNRPEAVTARHPGDGRFAAALGLSDEQKGQLRVLLSQWRQRRLAAGRDTAAAAPTADGRLAFAEFSAELAKILTPDQLARLRKFRQQRLAARPDARHGD